MSAEALDTAKSPTELVAYGERAWCRLEVYVFLCLAETSGNHLAAFAYGLSASKLGQRPIDKSVAQSGAVRECRRRSLERLRAFGSEDAGAGFTRDLLPSRGVLRDERDRAMILSIEKDIGSLYAAHAVRVATARFGGKAPTLQVSAKQLNDSAVPELVDGLAAAVEKNGYYAYCIDARANLFSARELSDLDVDLPW